jgi:hypothetical protein
MANIQINCNNTSFFIKLQIVMKTGLKLLSL